MAKKSSIQKDTSSEEKIIRAARTVFRNKGFAATRTRDIAEEAGINLALLNYYFRSKQALFGIIMEESLFTLLKGVTVVMNSTDTTLEEKVTTIVDNYYDMLLKEPELPLFILGELRRSPDEFATRMTDAIHLRETTLFRQIQEAIDSGKIDLNHPMHFIVNILALTVFPFLAAPLLKKVAGVPDEAFMAMIMQRKQMIPVWFDKMLAK